MLLVAALALGALVLQACGSSDDSSSSGQTAEVTSSKSECTGGETLKGEYTGFPDYLDPAISYTAEGWTAMQNVYIPLLTYKHASGEAGSEVIPGLAEDLPEVSADGKTYKLTLRKGLKYSDGTPVKASDFTYAVKRAFLTDSGGSAFYTDIVGAAKFQKTKKGDIPGIKTNDATGEVTIQLTDRKGTFTNELALMFVAPVPPDTPGKDLSKNPPPGTGPYMITKSDPGRGWSYERNPNWLANAKTGIEVPCGHMDKIEITIVRNQSTQVNDVIQGKANWMFDPPPTDRYADVKAKYEGKQFRNEPTISTYYFWMNTERPPFDDLKVRQAVNYAIDSAALERIYAGQIKATHQVLPPGMPGYKQFDLYPHSDAKAKALFKQANPPDKDVTVWTDSESPNDDAGAYLQDVLTKIGFNAKLKTINPDNYFTVIGNETTQDLDIGWSDWFQDYPHPNDFFDPLINGENIAKTNNQIFGYTDFPEINKQITELARDQLTPETEAKYAALDKEFMKTASWAPYGTRSLSTFVSSDIDLDKVLWNPTFSNDLTSFEFK